MQVKPLLICNIKRRTSFAEKARGFSLKIRYKINKLLKFNEIYIQSRIKCAESNDPNFILKFQWKGLEIAGDCSVEETVGARNWKISELSACAGLVARSAVFYGIIRWPLVNRRMAVLIALLEPSRTSSIGFQLLLQVADQRIGAHVTVTCLSGPNGCRSHEDLHIGQILTS